MSKPVVLCVDDEPTVLESLRIELRQVLGSDCLIETAEGGQEALEVFEELQQAKQDVALVLADYIMPGMKGDELLKQIHARSPKTLNIMLTGQADLAAIGRAIQYGKLYRYIAKPWQPKDLRLTVAEAVQSYLKDRLLETQTEKLQQMTLEMQQLNAGLEQQVQNRTAELQQKMTELEELNQLKDNFLHSVSHDLRTPLMGMLLVLQNLQRSDGEQIVLSQLILDRMIYSCERQLEMLNSLLQVQFGEVRGLNLNQEWINLGEFLEAIVDELEPLTDHYHAEVINPVTHDLPSVFADASQLRRVFENLISNALKHNPPGIQLQLKAEVVSGADFLQATNSQGTSSEGASAQTAIEAGIRGASKREAPGETKREAPGETRSTRRCSAELTGYATTKSAIDPTARFLYCCVQDNGSGMNPQECAALFERYAQSTRTRRSPGVGLGLYLCRQIITAHGGQIGACSTVGKGTEFWFTLPLDAQPLNSESTTA